MVRRPCLRKENRFVDAELPNIHSNYRDDEEAIQALEKGPAFMVKIYIVVEKQTLSRQISALRHIQDDRWKLHS